MHLGHLAKGSAGGASVEVAGSVFLRSGRGACPARREVIAAVRRTDGTAARSDVTQLARAAILGGGAFAAAAIGWIPSTLAAEGLSFAPAPLTANDFPALIASNPSGAVIAAVLALLGFRLVAVGTQAATSRVKGFQPLTLANIVKAEPRAVVVDIRPKTGRSGGPAWARYGKRALSLPYSRTGGEGMAVDEKFGQKLARLRGIGDGALVVLVDEDGSLAPFAGKQILKQAPSITSVCYIKGGAEGWKAAGMPWRSGLTLPSVKLPSVKLPVVKLPTITIDGIAESYRSNSGAYNLGLSASVVALSAALLISELDVLLEVVGLVGFSQLFLRNMVFAKDRSETIRKLREIRDEKIAVDSAAEDLQRLASAVLDGKKRRPSTARSSMAVGNGESGSAGGASAPADDGPAVGGTPAVATQ